MVYPGLQCGTIDTTPRTTTSDEAISSRNAIAKPPISPSKPYKEADICISPLTSSVHPFTTGVSALDTIDAPHHICLSTAAMLLSHMVSQQSVGHWLSVGHRHMITSESSITLAQTIATAAAKQIGYHVPYHGHNTVTAGEFWASGS